MSRIAVTPASPGQRAQALALLAESLPALALPTDPPVRVFVAHRPGQPGRVIGAAAWLPAPQRGGVWGFRAHCQVLAGERRHGVGRALITALAREAARWGVPRLISWDTLPDGPASDFIRAMGGKVAYTLHHFLPHKDTALPRCERLVTALRRHGHVPPGFELRPLHEVPRAPVLALHCSEFHAHPEAARRLFEERLAEPALRHLSVALWNGQTLAGYLLASRSGEWPEVEFWATPPELRSGWAAALLLHAFVARVVDGGGSQARFHCNERASAPMNFARRTGAPLERITRGWALESAPEPLLPTRDELPRRTSPAPRRLLLALPGWHLPARDLQAWWDEAPGPVNSVGWPVDARGLVPGGNVIAAGFDDVAQRCPDFWALDPACVQPPQVSDLARAARMSPSEVSPAQLAAVQAPVTPASAWLLARWVSRHNLGVHWASQPDAGSLALCLDGWAEWAAAIGLDAAAARAAEAGWRSLIELMLARYRALLGPDALIEQVGCA